MSRGELTRGQMPRGRLTRGQLDNTTAAFLGKLKSAIMFLNLLDSGERCAGMSGHGLNFTATQWLWLLSHRL